MIEVLVGLALCLLLFGLALCVPVIWWWRRRHPTIEILYGPAKGQRRKVERMDRTSITVAHPFDGTPEAGDSYKIRRKP